MEKAYSEVCQEVPIFKNIPREQVFQVIQENLQLHKDLSAEEAFENFVANFKTS